MMLIHFVLCVVHLLKYLNICDKHYEAYEAYIKSPEFMQYPGAPHVAAPHIAYNNCKSLEGKQIVVKKIFSSYK